MSYANGTTHYNLPQTVGSDKRDWSDANQAFQDIDAALYQATQDTAQAELDIDALEVRMDTAEQNIADNAGDISALDGRVTTVEGTVAQHTTQIADVRRDSEDMICAYNEASATSTHAYAVGDYFIYNDVLYRATASIGVGDTIVPDTNCSTTNVTTELLGRDNRVVASYTAGSGQTLGGCLQALFSQFPTFDKTKDYMLQRIGLTGSSVLRAPNIKVDSLEFTLTTFGSATTFDLYFYTISATSSSYRFRLNNAPSITVDDMTSSSVGEGTIFNLIEVSKL